MKKNAGMFAATAAVFLAGTSALALVAGDEAPDVSLASTSGGEINLQTGKGTWTVLYFFPKAFTPGCTRQACGIRDARSEIGDMGVVAYGVSTDDLETLKEFKAKYELTFDLLADPEGALSRAFGVMGNERARRVTFIIAPDGRITDVIDDVAVATHDQDVIRILRANLHSEETGESR